MSRLRKVGKSTLALVLAGVLALVPAVDSFALGGGNLEGSTDIDSSLYTLTEEAEESSENDEETTPETGNDESDETEGVPDSEDEDQKETETENGNGDADQSEEEQAGDESEDGNSEESESGNDEDGEISDDEAEDSDDEIGEESEADVDAEEDETDEGADTEEDGTQLPGLKNYVLSSDQLENKLDLESHLDDICQGEEGIDYVAGELVFLADTLEEAEKIAKGYGGSLQSFDMGVGVVSLSETMNVVSALSIAATSEEIVLAPAWPNYIYTICTDETDEIEEDGDVSETGEEDSLIEDEQADEVYMDGSAYNDAALAYNDPYLAPTSGSYQYQHMMVGSVYAWNAGYTGKGIKIAILDTGVNAHTELNIAYNVNYSSDSGTGDSQGHGTHVAGLAAAKNNNSAGGAGIAPGASIYNIKVLNSKGTGTSAGILRGIQAAISNKVDIISMSLGSHWYEGNYVKVVKQAYDSGIAVFAAAGNDGSPVKCYPAGYTGAYCIGSVQQNKGRSYFSNYGSWVKFSAPGSNLYSTSKSGGYEMMSGTSQATPIASGTAAVILSADAGIRAKTGKARVNALISKMNKGKVSGSGGAAGIVSLPKALGIPVSTSTPKAPVFTTKSQTVTGTALNVTITPVVNTDMIYYSIDGKNPTFKSGVPSANAIRYTKAISVGGKAKVTVKAIAVNACGKVSKAASATYTFKPLVTAVNITGQNILIRGKTTALKASVTPDYAGVKGVTWKIAPEKQGVTVDKNGKVKATNKAVAGAYTITATSKDKGAKAGTFKITVTEAARIKSVEFKDNKGKAKKSDTVTLGKTNIAYSGLVLKVTNVDGSAGTVKDVTFSSSNAKVATVAATGQITVVGAGKAVITATANDGSGKKATFTLTVKRQITSIAVNGPAQLSVGNSVKMTATVNSDAAKKTVTWEVKAPTGGQGVTVSGGTVKAAKNAVPGTYTITAKATDGSNVSGSATIKVTDNAITKIKLSSSKEKIFRSAGNYKAKTSVQITAAITAQTAAKVPVTSTAVEFVSSNPGVAKVTQSGTTAVIAATGAATGTAKITCRALDGSGKSATCTITVVNPASKLTVSPPGGNAGLIAKGKKVKLSTVFEEDFGAVSSKAVTWTSSNKAIATVDGSGRVKGIAKGTVTITAAAKDGSGLTGSYSIQVTDPIKNLKLQGFYDSKFIITAFTVNKQYSGVSILYNGTTYNNKQLVCPYVTISVGDQSILTAGWESNGKLTVNAKKKGKTTITIKAMDGTNVKKTYRVIVR